MAEQKQRSLEELEPLKPKFFEAIDAGLTVNAACAAIGINNSTGARWKTQRETGAVDYVVAARQRREEIAAYSYKHGVEKAAKKYKTTKASVYSTRFAVRAENGLVGTPVPTAEATNGHAPEPEQPKKEAPKKQRAPAAPAVEVSTVTTSTAFSATMKVMQILEPLAEADRARVARAVLQFVQGGIG